jgi:hypothetical protein
VQFNEADDIAFVNGALVFPCGRGTTLEVCVILKICDFLIFTLKQYLGKRLYISTFLLLDLIQNYLNNR